MKRTATLTLLLAVAVISGCEEPGLQRAEAYKRYHETRSLMVYGVATECFKVGDLDKAYANTVQAIGLDENYVPARVLLAKVLLERARYTRALKELDKAEKLAPGSAEVVFLRGVAFEKLRQFPEALKCYQKARVLDEENANYVTASAEVLVSMGKSRSALELLKTRLSRDDTDQTTLALAGELAMLVGEPAEAAEFFQHCLDGDPQNLTVREELARAHFLAGNYVEALAVLEKLAAHPVYRDKVAWVRIMMGNSYLALKRPRQARDAYRTATVIEPEEPRAWSSLAKATMALGDLTGTVRAARRALDVGGECLEATTLLGYALLRQGRAAEAKRLLAGAVASYPKDPVLLCTLGRCYEALGRDDQAVACYENVLQSHPDHTLAKALAGKHDQTAKK